jgi:hypothetical protein
MDRERLPIYVNRYPDGQLSLTCAHCAIDAQLERAESVALYAESRPEGAAIAWDADLTPEHLIAAAAAQCMHLAAYTTVPGTAR